MENRVEELRKRLGMNQEDFAKALLDISTACALSLVPLACIFTIFIFINHSLKNDITLLFCPLLQVLAESLQFFYLPFLSAIENTTIPLRQCRLREEQTNKGVP